MTDVSARSAAARKGARTRPVRTGSFWTEARKAELRRRWEAGESSGVIAQAFGTTRSVVISKCRDLGLLRRTAGKRQPAVKLARGPSKEALAVLRFIEAYRAEHGGCPSRATMAAGLGMTRPTIGLHIKHLARFGLVRHRPWKRDVELVRFVVPSRETSAGDPEAHAA